MRAKKEQPKVFAHSQCVIVRRGDNFDVIDPVSGKWQNFPTQRAAKWSASIWRRLSDGFGYVAPAEETISSCVQHENRKLSITTVRSEG